MTFSHPLGTYKSIHPLPLHGLRIAMGEHVPMCAAPCAGCQRAHMLSFAWDLVNFS